VRPGARVLVKPNVVAPIARGVTSFTILRVVIEAVREAGGTPFIGDCPGMEFNSDKTFELLGYPRFADEMGVELVNFDHDETVYRPVRMGLVRRLALPRRAVEADALINLPRLKRHGLCTVTLGLKNLFGVLCKESRRALHVFGLHRGIAWLNHVLPTTLTVLDGTTICERPVFGEQTPLGILLASRDTLALDVTACRFLDVDPRRVRHIRAARALGLGQGDATLVGDVDAVPDAVGTGGALSLKQRANRAAFWATFTSDLVYNRLTGKTLLPWANVTLGSHPVIDAARCDLCGACAAACPMDAIDLERKAIDYTLCREVRCMRCYDACPQRAVLIKGIRKVKMESPQEETP
ncbi:DUF362 domain-containing protein, partial [bacterium]|nr:DUF362 domain-containing protein [bacterium]